MTDIRRPNRALAMSAVLVLLALFVLGGYVLRWRWTGLSARVTLWDWLQALALPVAVASVPILLRHRGRLTPGHRRVLIAALSAFGVFVAFSYAVPLGWTGFSGNTLWNWLELLVLPAAVAAASLWHDANPGVRTHLVAGTGLTTFAVLVACGYLVPWHWTGFSGNTVWDWIKLLMLPLLIPTILVPAVIDRLDGRLARFADRREVARPRSDRRVSSSAPAPAPRDR
ncbi:MAG: hypothetical protein ACRDVG_04465 [Jatrophihabitantaceae bacterium]